MDNRIRIPFSILRPRKGFGSSWWVALLFALLPTFSWGQQITRLEYFFDIDPGFGNGTPVQVTPAPVLDNFNFSANISALSDGFHTLFIRARDDSSRWGHTLQRPFYKLTVSPPTYGIDLLEYFFNSDPGPGNGTPIQVTPTNELDPFSIALDITSLPEGFNALYFRARNQGGSWSMLVSRIFYKLSIQPSPRTLSSYEYFFNTDPGHGQGIPVPVSVSGAVDSTAFVVDISSFQDGFHSIFFRGRDNTGAWSHVQSRTFFKFSVPPAALPVVDLEYFIDTDPGLDNANKIAITPTTDLNNFSVAIDVSQLTEGFHKLGFRVKNSDNRWSHTNLIPFYRVALDSLTPDIIRMEYFFNQDPGYGQATPIAFTPDNNLSINLNIDISALSNGFNFLFIRALDEAGRWSHNQMRAFYKEARQDTLLPIVYAEYFIDQDPGFNNGITIPLVSDSAYQDLVFPIDIDSLSEGFHKLFLRTRDAKGKWSMTTFQPFFKQIFRDTLGKIVAVEYFYDTDPGAGNGISVPLTPQANIPFLAWSLNLSGINFGQHNLFIRTRDEFGTWSLTNRKEIFYYLDSLPTASLSGPVGVCIQDTGYFEVTLTGTGPWNIVFNNGFTTDTISNIAVTPHFIPVVPDSSGTFTAQVLMVQDIYYTGLYTGIPIEYQVYPLPVAAGAISGPQNICEGSQSVGFSVYHIGNASSYQWTVPPGAVIVGSGYYWTYSYIYVDFPPGAQSGNVTVRGINHCGAGIESVLPVTLRSHPTVEAGPDQYIPWGDSAVLFATPSGGSPPYTYSWSPWWVFDNYTSQNPTAWPGQSMGVSVTVYDTFGCTATDGLTLFVGNPNGTTFSGIVRYDNAAGSPISFSNVMMKQGSDIIYDTLTDASGYYRFPEVAAGYYNLSAQTNKAWDAVNATDALLIAKYFVDSLSLSGLRRIAADVNASGFVNAVDALWCAKRFVGLVDSFPSGDWYFENFQVYSHPSGFQNYDIRAILFGDVDASYTPGKKSPTLSLDLHQKLMVSAEGRIEIPLMTAEPMELGAISLILYVPDGFTLHGITLPEGRQGELLYNLIGDQVRISWFSLEPALLDAADPLFLLSLSYASLPKLDWKLGDASSLADAQGHPYPQARLFLPKLVREGNGFVLGDNYPNPFNTQTIIPYTLPAEAQVRLSILNLLGEEVFVIHNGKQAAGEHLMKVDAAKLAPGIYHYRLLAETAGQRFEQTRKLVVTN